MKQNIQSQTEDKFTRIFFLYFIRILVCYCDVYQCWHEFLHDFMRFTATNVPISLAKTTGTKWVSFVYSLLDYNIYTATLSNNLLPSFFQFVPKIPIYMNKCLTAINWRPRSSHRFSETFFFFSFVTVFFLFVCCCCLLLVDSLDGLFLFLWYFFWLHSL